MALTIASLVDGVESNGQRSVTATVTFDNSYPTGGEEVTLTKLGLRDVQSVQEILESGTAAGAQARLIADLTDKTAPKLLLYTAASTEASNASNQSSVVARLKFVGH
jgi:hypothetical protein